MINGDQWWRMVTNGDYCNWELFRGKAYLSPACRSHDASIPGPLSRFPTWRVASASSLAAARTRSWEKFQSPLSDSCVAIPKHRRSSMWTMWIWLIVSCLASRSKTKKHQTTKKTSGFSSDFAPVEIKIMVDAHYWKNQTLSDVSHCGIK